MDKEQFQQFLSAFTRQQQDLIEQISHLRTNNPGPVISTSSTVNYASISPFENFDIKKEKFTCYLERFENYLAMKNITDTEKKAQLLCTSIGSIHYNGLAAFLGPEKSIKSLSYDNLVNNFKQLLIQHRSVIVSQHYFLGIYQKENQTISEYVSTLQQDLTECDFYVKCSCEKTVSISEVFLRAQFIRGIRENWIRKQLLQSPDQKFESLLSKAIALEASGIESLQLSQQNQKQQPAETNKVSVAKPDNRRNIHHSRDHIKSTKNRFKNQNQSTRNESRTRKKINYKELGIDNHCLRCGSTNHRIKECRNSPAKYKCNLCDRIGHVSRVCITTLLQNKKDNYKQKSQQDKVMTVYDSDEDVNMVADGKEKIMVPLEINGIKCKLECDSGSAKTLVSKEFFKKCGFHENKLYQDGKKFRDYTNNIFYPIGCLDVTVKFKNRTINNKIYVTDRSDKCIVGREWLIPLQIIKIEDINVIKSEPDISECLDNIKKDFPAVFQQKIGKVPNFVVSYQLKEGAKPVYRPPQKVPHALLPEINKTIDRLVAEGVLERVETSEWGTPAVFVEKADGTIRLCGNYKVTVNDLIQDVRFPIPTIEEIFNKMGTGKYYCKLDLKDAYLHIPVDEQTARMQTITTPQGAYKVKRMYYGIKVAPSKFNEYTYQILKDVPGTVAFFDDIVVQGDTINECEQRLRKLLRILQDNNLHVNEKKCTFFKTEIEYLGHVISQKGLQKSEKKIKAIQDAPQPKTVKEVRQFLGLVNHYHKFIPNAASLTFPLYQLLKKENRFYWSPECEKTFKKIKKIITSEQVLTPYRPKLPVYLETDASPFGISAILSHKFSDGSIRPIAFASRTLSKAESNYTQLDREALALFWGAKKFFQYIYGRKFTFIVDNKPLQQILNPKKELSVFTTSRMLRYAVFLSQLDYNIIHRTADKHENVDYLSRNPVEIYPVNIIDECMYLQNDRLNTIATSSKNNENILSISKLQQASKEDPDIKKLYKALKDGTNTDPTYSINNGLIFKGLRVMVPKSMQKAVLNELHATHIGIVKMKCLARKYVYWYNIDKDIEAVVRSCKQCADQRKSPTKAPLHQWEDAGYAFQRIHIDYAELNHQQFFIIVDSFSKWVEVYTTIQSPNSAKTILFLKDYFSKYGLVEEIVSDNASIFKSEEFIDFTSYYQINQRFIAPCHAATNGQAERIVQYVKDKLKKMVQEPDTIKEKLIAILGKHRITPTSTGKTPSELVFGKTLRNRLDLLIPVEKKAEKKKSILKVREFRLGERVQSRNYTASKLWRYGTVVERLGRLHYLIELDDGYVIKRHIDQLRATEVQPPECKSKSVQFDQILPQVAVTPVVSNTPKSYEVKTPVEQPKRDNSKIVSNSQPQLQTSETGTTSEDSKRDVMVPHQPMIRKSTRVRKTPQRLDL